MTKGVTYERILNARSEPQNWLTYYGAYDGQRYSPLDQINTENVKRLTPAWVFQCGSVGLHAGKSTYSFEASPLVVDGIMFVSGWDGWVWALDARTGAELWQYKHAIPYDVSLCCGNVNRGVAVADGHGLRRHPERPHHRARRRDRQEGLGPDLRRRAGRRERHGRAAGRQGHGHRRQLRRRVRRRAATPTRSSARPASACGAATWSPSPASPGPRPGRPTARPGQRGGANCWVTSTFDPELNLLYFGTGNPCPDFDGGVREGDNLYTDSGVAVDVDTGEIKAHFQYTPHDLWDYDSTMEHILFDLDGQKLAAHFDKNGFLYILDRTNMEAVRVAPFVDRIDWGEVDEKGNVTPKIYPDKEGDPVHFWPGPAGAKEWTHAAYSPKTELLYAPVQDVGATATRRRREFKESIPYWGAGVAVDLEDMAGSISAFDPRTGKEKWRWRNDIPMCSSVLATGGDLVFAGEPTGEFNALDASTGELLWQFQCGSGHHSSPCDLQHRRPAVHRRADRLGRAGPKGSCPGCSARARAARCSSSRCPRTRPRHR